MLRSVAVLILLFASALGSGCASIVSKSSYPVKIVSSPTGARFSVRTQQGVSVAQGTTPTTVHLKAGDGYFRRARYVYDFAKPGYASGTAEQTATIDGWYWANPLLSWFGIIGMVTLDPANGSMWKLGDTVYCELSEAGAATPVRSPPGIETRQPQVKRESATATQEEAVQTPLDPNVVAKKRQLRQLLSDGKISEQEYHDLMKEVVDE